MTILIILLCLVFLGIIVVQIGKVTDLSERLRGQEDVQRQVNNSQSKLMLVFLAAFLFVGGGSCWYYKNYLLGYGPHISASEHGGMLDDMFNNTTIITAIVFVITQVALFYFAYKYKFNKNRPAKFISHDDKLEIIWTAIPAITMAFLVVNGLSVWNKVMADIEPGEEFMEIEAMGQQFGWVIRYPGADAKLGARSYKKISSANPLGQIWTDKANLDDFHPSEIVLPVGKKVRVRITARDVLHNFNLPHFRLKMDAVPGMPTYFVFTPNTTTEEYRQRLALYDEYQQPEDPTDPESPAMWEAFNYELACAELCGKGHYSMRRIVRIVEQAEYDAWVAEQKSHYMTQIKGKDGLDPYFSAEAQQALLLKERSMQFTSAISEALKAESAEDKIIRLDHVTFQTGKSLLTDASRYQLDDLVKVLTDTEKMTIEVAGHTDNVGDASSNMKLSSDRARAVSDYLISHGISKKRLKSKGYGQTTPVADNTTSDGRQQNRRTEFKILTQ